MFIITILKISNAYQFLKYRFGKSVLILPGNLYGAISYKFLILTFTIITTWNDIKTKCCLTSF
jgi:hypothetical protein